MALKPGLHDRKSGLLRLAPHRAHNEQVCTRSAEQTAESRLDESYDGRRGFLFTTVAVVEAVVYENIAPGSDCGAAETGPKWSPNNAESCGSLQPRASNSRKSSMNLITSDGLFVGNILATCRRRNSLISQLFHKHANIGAHVLPSVIQ